VCLRGKIRLEVGLDCRNRFDVGTMFDLSQALTLVDGRSLYTFRSEHFFSTHVP
jgi:hypothetical protein